MNCLLQRLVWLFGLIAANAIAGGINSALKNVGFNGWVSIEDGEDPKVGMEHLRLSPLFLFEPGTWGASSCAIS